VTFCNQLEAAVLCLPLGAKPLLIFNVGASDGAIEAGAMVENTMGWVGGLIDPVGAGGITEDEMTHSEPSSPSAAILNPSSSESALEAVNPSQL
jgi:hypothetical protein